MEMNEKNPVAEEGLDIKCEKPAAEETETATAPAAQTPASEEAPMSEHTPDAVEASVAEEAAAPAEEAQATEEANIDALMSEFSMDHLPEEPLLVVQRKPKKPSILVKILKAIGLFILRLLLVVVTVAVLAVAALYMVCDLIFNGPSPEARNVLTMSMLESSGMKWFPAIFLGEEMVAEIQKKDDAPLPDDITDISQIVIDKNNVVQSGSEWDGHPDGIIIEHVPGDTYSAHVMLIRDPSSVYLATSTDHFSKSIPGVSINYQMELEGAIAGINGGAFFDNGTGSSQVGSVPIGLVISEGRVAWNDGRSYNGFAGFNEDNILIVANTITAKQAAEMKIRDGCCFGPVLIMNGEINQAAYNDNSGYNPRTGIGQRADGAVIFVCIDGRQAGSLGGGYNDMIDIMAEYGAVNACLLDGGSSTVMFYRDNYGLYGEAGKLMMVNNYSLLQQAPRRMPTYFFVRPASEEK